MKRLDALEGLRGYAALLVFFTHAFGLLAAKLYAVDADRASLSPNASPWLNTCLFLFRSYHGVDLFFVLSGLLMADIAARRWPGSAAFLKGRALRIYPSYLASTAIVLVAVTVLFNRSFTAAELAGNAVFLHGFYVVSPVNPVSWSLAYEVVFYLAVPWLAAVIAGRAERGHLGVLLAMFVATIAVSAALPGEKSIFLAYFALFIPGLYLGLAPSEQRERLARRLPLALALGGWIAFELAVRMGWLTRFDALYYVASGIAGALVVLKACDSAGGLARLLTHRAPLWLGHYSYSFFLIHYIVLHVLGLVLDLTIGQGHRVMYALALVGGGFVLSALGARVLYEVTEKFYFMRRR